VRAATWPDDIKNKATHPGSVDDGEEPTNPNAAANIGYSDKLMHKYWHYVDLPFSPDGTTTADPKNRTPNADQQVPRHHRGGGLQRRREVLRRRVADPHVGDVHQPLHATSRFTKLLPKATRAAIWSRSSARRIAATTCIASGTACSTPKRPESLDRGRSQAQEGDRAATGEADPHVWITESFDIAKKTSYGKPIGTTSKTVTLRRLTKRPRRRSGVSASRSAARAGPAVQRRVQVGTKLCSAHSAHAGIQGNKRRSSLPWSRFRGDEPS